MEVTASLEFALSFSFSLFPVPLDFHVLINSLKKKKDVMSSKYYIKSLCLYYAVHEIAAVIKTSAGNAAKDFTGTQLTRILIWKMSEH